MTLSKSISAVSLILALGVYSFAQPLISKSYQTRESNEDTSKSLDDYREIEKAFNETVAGRFPFADINDNQPLAEADIESIVAFFKLLDKKGAGAKEALERIANARANQDEALEFMRKMEEVRAFFAGFLEKERLPFFDFDVQFRVNQDKEIGANQIIDWSLEIGKKRLRLLDKDRTGRWLFGEPIRLLLRWANDSPMIPSDSFPPQSHMKLEGQSVTFAYNNTWSLLLLMLKHRARRTDFSRGVEVEPYTLKFDVPTQPNPKLSNVLQQAQPNTLETTSVEVFMRITLLAPGKQEPLVLPDAFPTQAPQLRNNEGTLIKVE